MTEHKLNHPKVEFVNCKNNGDYIEALVRFFADDVTGDFVLNEARKDLHKVRLALEANKYKILDKQFKGDK